jgi:hypothetical protein
VAPGRWPPPVPWRQEADGTREGAAAAGRAHRPRRAYEGTTVLDRTTLTPLGGGEVRQHIEVSSDRGATWRSSFDAVYRRID